MIRNDISWKDHLAQLRGTHIDRDLQRFDASLRAINALQDDLRRLSDPELLQRSQQLAEDHRRSSQGVETPDETVCIPAFALAREAADRCLGLRPYDVQVVAALAMAEGST